MIRLATFTAVLLALLFFLVGEPVHNSLFGFELPLFRKVLTYSIVAYATWFLVLRWHAERQRPLGTARALALGGLLLWGTLALVRGGMADANAADTFTAFYIGIVAGQAFGWLDSFVRARVPMFSLRPVVLLCFILILTGTSFMHPKSGAHFQYRGLERWAGLWTNPNISGLLMAVGVVLATGEFLGRFRLRSESTASVGKKRASVVAMCVLLACGALMGSGLFRSFSRGAWLAAICGLVYLAWCFRRSALETVQRGPEKALPVRLRRFSIHASGAILLMAVAVLGFWNSRDSDHRVVRRVFSVANRNDLSWGNRLVASTGALQMMADRPWFGFGWNQPERVFGAYYQPARLAEGKAIILNNYFLLGTTLGIPALACLLLLLFLKWIPGHRATEGARTFASAEHWRAAVCRAGVCVLLVGFVFNSGLFYLPLAAALWILLEFGSTDEDSAAVPSLPWWPIAGTVVLLLGVMSWARATDPFERTWFELKIPGGHVVRGVAVVPKEVQPFSTVIYIHESGETLMDVGVPLRQLAGMGMTAVGLEYDQNSPEAFAQQFAALLSHLNQLAGSSTNGMAWVGTGLGARRALGFWLKHPDSRPEVLAVLSGGWPAELENSTPRDHSPPVPVLLVQGAQDEFFPGADVQRLAAALRLRGADVTARILPQRSHGLEPDKALAIRLTAEYCRAVLAPNIPFGSTEEKRNPLVILLWIVPPFIAVTIWWFKRARPTWTPETLDEAPIPRRREMYLRWAAAGALGVAAVQTAWNFVIPQLAVSETTLALAMHSLVSAREQSGFVRLSADPVWRGKPLQTLLDHMHLASYNRELIKWKVDDALFEEFVLSPVIDSAHSGLLNWRRPLWEHFHPRVRRAETPEEAARILVRSLREQVTISTAPIARSGPETLWRRRITDDAGFQRLYVAALRSVGVAAKLGRDHQAELWTGTAWTAAPQPIAASFLTPESP